MKYSGFINMTQGIQILDRSMLYKLVFYTQAFHHRSVLVVCHKFQDSTPHSTFQYSILYRQYTMEFLSYLM